ncbi:hypothetical protein ACFFJM_16270, partial [Falsigemmobacter intermedius]
LRLATADRLANCIALCCVVAWRVTWLTMLSRETPVSDPAAVFTDEERHLLECATPDRKRHASYDLAFYVRAVSASAPGPPIPVRQGPEFSGIFYLLT